MVIGKRCKPSCEVDNVNVCCIVSLLMLLGESVAYIGANSCNGEASSSTERKAMPRSTVVPAGMANCILKTLYKTRIRSLHNGYPAKTK